MSPAWTSVFIFMVSSLPKGWLMDGCASSKSLANPAKKTEKDFNSKRLQQDLTKPQAGAERLGPATGPSRALDGDLMH
jgi:hypothetical protein